MNPRRLAEQAKARDDSKSLFRNLVDRSIEHRCDACNHKIGIGKIGEGTIFETKCSKCSSLVVLAVPK